MAVAQALGEGRPELAREVLSGPVPPALGPLTGSALLVVRTPGASRALLCVRTPDGWRTARLARGELVLRPVTRAGLTTDLAAALAGALAGAAA